MDRLPEELVLHIFSFLDSTPPSELKARQEPSLDLTTSSNTLLKNVCCVSKLWRRVALPILFSCSRLRLDCDLAREGFESCSICGIPTDEDDLDAGDLQQLHTELAKTAHGVSPTMKGVPQHLVASMELPGNPTPKQTMAWWSLMLYHQLRHMLSFLERVDISGKVRSLVLLRDKPEAVEHSWNLKGGWQHLGATLFWRQLFRAIDPERVVILAPPHDLGFLTTTVVDIGNVGNDRSWYSVDIELTSLCHSIGRSMTWTFTSLNFERTSTYHRSLLSQHIILMRKGHPNTTPSIHSLVCSAPSPGRTSPCTKGSAVGRSHMFSVW